MGKIIWLASYPRSGNTWLRAILHTLLQNPDTRLDINILPRFAVVDSDPRHFSGLDPRPQSTWMQADVARLRPRAHARVAESRPEDVFVKTHNALAVDHDVPTITMSLTAAAIYMVRNPLDVVISYAYHTGQTIDQTIARMARDDRTVTDERHVSEYRGSWSTHVKSWTQQTHPGLHVLRYEDACDDPFAAFGALAAFLQLDPPQERLARAIDESAFAVLRAQEDEHGFVENAARPRRFFRAGTVGQWRAVLSPAQVRRICRQHGEQMARFGYLPSDGQVA